MTLRELILSFRVEANDKVEPYFHEDDILKLWFNEAVQEACIRGRLIREWVDDEVCRIDILAGKVQYQLHESLYEIISARIRYDNSSSHPLKIVSTEMLDRIYGSDDWRNHIGDPEYLIQGDTDIRVVPTPTKDAVLQLEGYRLPLQDMVEPEDKPTISKAHHRQLVNWVLYKAFSVPDEEFVDGDKSVIALANFEQYFGLRPDSDLRRMTRHDVPQVVQAFMP